MGNSKSFNCNYKIIGFYVAVEDLQKKSLTKQEIKLSTAKAEYNMRELFTRISMMYGYSFEEIRNMSMPEIMILKVSYVHRLCEKLGVSYNSDNQQENDIEDNNYDETGYPKTFETINFNELNVQKEQEKNYVPTVNDFINWNNSIGATLIDNRS